MKLNLGCGHRKREGFLNCDSSPQCSPDMVLDLEDFPWPFDAGEVDEVLMQHVLEHVGQNSAQFIGIMKELYRVCAPGAVIHIEVPHPRSDGFLCDPTHVRPIMPQMFALFSKKACEASIAKGWPNTPLALIHDVDFEVADVQMYLAPVMETIKDNAALVQQAIDTNFNVVNDIHITLKRI